MYVPRINTTRVNGIYLAYNSAVNVAKLESTAVRNPDASGLTCRSTNAFAEVGVPLSTCASNVDEE